MRHSLLARLVHSCALVVMMCYLGHPTDLFAAPDHEAALRRSTPRLLAPPDGDRAVRSSVRFVAEIPVGARDPRLVLSRSPFATSDWSEVPANAGFIVAPIAGGVRTLAELGVALTGDETLWWTVVARDARSGQLRTTEVRSVNATRPFARPVGGPTQLTASARGSMPSFEAAPAGSTPASRPAIELGAGYRLVPGAPLPAIPARLSLASLVPEEPAAGRRAYILQFSNPDPDRDRSRIEAAGGTIIAHVPSKAYLVRLPGTASAKLATEADAPWLTRWEPAYKLSPELDITVEVRDTLLAQVFPDADRANLTQALADLGAANIEVHDNGINVIARFALDRGALASVAALDAIAWIETAPRVRPFNDQAEWVTQTGVPESRRIWDMGLRGQSQVIMNSDSGIRTDHDMFRDSTLAITTWGDYPTHRKIIAYKNGSENSVIEFGDEPNANFHGTHTSGSIVGFDAYNGARWSGVARDARLYFMDLGGTYTYGGLATPPDLNDLFQPSFEGNAGGAARIASASWGASVNGAYTLHSMQVDQFMWSHPDYLIAFATGNDFYPGHVGSPATAKDCISVGALGNGAKRNQMATFTSRGPTRDLRRKPTISAPGDSVVSSIGNTRWSYSAYSGTSMATPIVAGSLALIRQYLTEGWYPTGSPVGANAFSPSAALLKAMAINSGANDVLGFQAPDFNIGWGRLTLDDVLYFPGDTRGLVLVEDAAGLHDRQFVEYQIQVSDPPQPLEISLCWTDAPGSPIAAVQIVNDLDLRLMHGNTTYLGNVYFQGNSVQGGLRDSLNVEEGVRVAAPAAGTWIVRVEAPHVGNGPQPFALCITGGVSNGAGSIALDRPEYALTDTLRVQVVDTDALDPVDVTVTSGSEPGGEILQLHGADGRFTGSIAVAPTLAAPGDGVLSVSLDDPIRVTYADIAPGQPVTAEARVTGLSPEIRDVHATALTPNSTLVTWSTDGPATSRVYFSNAGPLLTVAETPGYSTEHSVRLSGLLSGQDYAYDVESTSPLGVSARDSLGGEHRWFTAKSPGSVAFVLGDPSMEEQASWIASLEALGVDFDLLTGPDVDPVLVGDASVGLRSYAAVLWQAGKDDYPALTDSQRAAIDSLLEGGGRMLICGHDIGYSLGDFSSPSWNPDREEWLSTALKARYTYDPAGFRWEVGVPGDPVSGDYTAGIPYWGLGYGRAGDLVAPGIVNDGVVSRLWTTEGGTPWTDGLRWESGGPRGSGALSFWGGHSSRLIDMFFEWSRLSGDSLQFTTGYDPERTSVLGASLDWLLGRRRPTATIASPNGGEVVTGEFLPILFTTVADSGFAITRRELSYSIDGGESWTLIEANVTSPVGYIWDLPGIISGSPVLNSTRVLVRLRAYDNGAPQLRGEDLSNATFTIARTGGDTKGPVMVAGSARVSPYPVIRGREATLTAAFTDGETGGSLISAAEWSVGAAAVAAGAGAPMAGSFDSSVVTVSAAVPTGGLSPGSNTLWVRGRDAAGNWGVAGPFELVATGDGVTAVGDVEFTTYLAPAAPNPFRSSTLIRFGLARSAEVRVDVFDTQGRRIRTLENGVLEAGPHETRWDGRNRDDAAVGAGVYFVRLVTPAGTFKTRIVSLK